MTPNRHTPEEKPDRKKDHIALAFEAMVDKDKLDERFYYEPL